MTMGVSTGIIKFNVTQRGRKHRGVDRNFDTALLANIINGGEVQEKVKNRDMLGYFGHWPRVKFGLNPTEGGIVDGKVVALEPAIVTTFLKAYPDGTIEHEEEFLDTATGKMAARMYQSRTGGFSSAIDCKRAGDKQLPRGFFGFDYVMEPNFTTNRGYDLAVLDGITDEGVLATFDAVMEYNAMFDSLNAMFDSLQQQYDLQADTLQRMALEREELYSMLAKVDGKREVSLDGVMMVETFGGGEGKFEEAEAFLDASLIRYQPVKAPDDPAPTGAGDKVLSRRFGV